MKIKKENKQSPIEINYLHMPTKLRTEAVIGVCVENRPCTRVEESGDRWSAVICKHKRIPILFTNHDTALKF